MAKEMTKREKWAIALSVFEGIEDEATRTLLTEFANHEVELLGNRKTNKPTATQLKTADTMTKVEEILANGETMTVTAIVNRIGDTDVSAPRVTAALSRLVTEGKAVREVVKGKPVFHKA